jgi:hypothetical protein
MRVLGAVMIGVFLAALDQTVVGTALPKIITTSAATTSTRGRSPRTC